MYQVKLCKDCLILHADYYAQKLQREQLTGNVYCYHTWKELKLRYKIIGQ